MSTMKTREQDMAKLAWVCVSEVKKDARIKKEFSTVAKKLPSLIMTNGLGQTLAFLLAKAEGKQNNHHRQVYQAVSNWVIPQVFGEESQGKDLLGLVLEKSSVEYRRATAEAMAFAGWLKRFAEAELGS